MSVALENSGFCLFGSDSDGPPGANGVAPLGAKFPPSGARCRVRCTYKGGAKIEKGQASGKSGAKLTFTGSKVATIDVTIDWPDIDPTATAMELSLLTISPHGANKGKAWDWTERFAGLYAVAAVMVEEMEGPDPKDGSDEMVVKLKLSGWDKQQQANAGTGTGATPTSSEKFVPMAPGATIPGSSANKPTAVP
jgi:hypothetical protein